MGATSVLENFLRSHEHLERELKAKGVKLHRLIYSLRSKVKEVSHKAANKLLDHNVLLKEIDEQGVSGKKIGKSYHNFVKTAVISKLLVESKSLFLCEYN